MSLSLLSDSYQCICIIKSLPGITVPLQLPCHIFLAKILKTVVILSPLLPHLPFTTQPTGMLMISSLSWKQKAIRKQTNKKPKTPKPFLRITQASILSFFQSPSKATSQQNLTYLVIPALLKYFLHLSSKAFQSPSFLYISLVISSQSSLLVSLHLHLSMLKYSKNQFFTQLFSFYAHSVGDLI